MKQSELVDFHLIMDGVDQIGRSVELVGDNLLEKVEETCQALESAQGKALRVVIVGNPDFLRKLSEIEGSLKTSISIADLHEPFPFAIPRSVGKINAREHWERPFGNRVKTRLSHSTKSRRRGFR